MGDLNKVWLDANGNLMVGLGEEANLITQDQLDLDEGGGHFIMDGEVFAVQTIKDGGEEHE